MARSRKQPCRCRLASANLKMGRLMAKRRRRRPYQSKCCKRVELEDEFSVLPDHILLYILSLLTLKEAVATNILSRRWRFLWTSLPSLNFRYEEVMQSNTEHTKRLIRRERDIYTRHAHHELTVSPRYDVEDENRTSLWHDKLYTDCQRDRYIHVVNQVLRFYNGLKLHDFGVHFPLLATSSYHIDLWVAFAISMGVSRLELDFSPYPFRLSTGVSKSYSIPLDLFDKTKGMEPYLMQLDSVLSIPTSSFNVQNNRFKSLRQLVLKFVNVTDEVFETILSGCTSLECLYLLHSRRLVNLKHTVPHLKLKCLEIYRCFNLENMEIFAPNLVTFKYLGPIINICIKDAKQLINVRMDTSRPYGYPDRNSLGLVNPQRKGFVFGQFARYLSQLEYLRMNVSCFEEKQAFSKVPLFCNLKHLSLTSYNFCNGQLGGQLGVPACYQTAFYFLKASPFLHRLELNFQLPPDPDGWQALTRIPISEHKYLKEVLVSGFFGHKIVMDFIMDIVDCTIGLERIEITTCYLDGIMMTGGPISVMARDYVARVETSIRELRRRLPQYVQLNFLDDC